MHLIDSADSNIVPGMQGQITACIQGCVRQADCISGIQAQAVGGRDTCGLPDQCVRQANLLPLFPGGVQAPLARQRGIIDIPVNGIQRHGFPGNGCAEVINVVCRRQPQAAPGINGTARAVGDAAGTGGVTTLGGNAANDFKALTKFDASGFTGDLTVDFDTGTESDAGITILASSKGSNNIKMSTGTQADVVKFTSANVSTINKITSLAQFDSVGEDKIDLSAFALGADTTIGTSAVKPAGDIAGFFTGTARIVTHDDGTDSFVYVDANKDGNFNAGSDLAIKLVGVTGTGGAAANIDSYTLADFILA